MVTIPLVILLVNFISRSRARQGDARHRAGPRGRAPQGINVDTTISLTFLLGGLLAGAAGLVYALYQTNVWFFQGFTAGLLAFTAAVLGGIGNLKGAVLGGLIIGIIQQISDNRIEASGRPAIVFALPHPDPRLPAAGPARREDAGGRMSATVTSAATSGRRHEAPSSAVLRRARRHRLRDPAAAVLRPGARLHRATCTLRARLLVMALGLNVVVGFAGLLDLGYVAFYAIGAYTVGWFASAHFAERRTSTSRVASSRRTCPASTSTS